ncbi:MAG TPA: uroporphyrinogen decarboxylase family protein [Ruminiclostridium sp.]
MGLNDGIHAMVNKKNMSNSVVKMREFYEQRPGAAIHQQEFYLADFTLEKWKQDGKITGNENFKEMFGYDDEAKIMLGELGWCEAAMYPEFETKVLEDRGKHELVLDSVGRHVLYFKGKRTGFMPEYVDHPVKDYKTWEENIKWRLNPNEAGRYDSLATRMEAAKKSAALGEVVCQNLSGGCMYLRSLMGPVEWLYMVYDEPELIHDCMKTWLALADRVCAEHQKNVTLDELFIAEDLCFKSGPLISPDMVREYFFPYYQQLISNIKARQIDKSRHLFIQIDTDGNAGTVIDLYKEIGMDYMSPFEVASNCDVVAIRKKYPDLLMRGGFDKRILAESIEAIDREVDRILPFMKKHGGFIPSCDHLVPTEVSFENYVHFRKRLLEF